MYRSRLVLALGLFAATAALADEKTIATIRVYTPRDGKSFAITDKDVVRFEGPSLSSVGSKTTVMVTAGYATVTERAYYSVNDGVVRSGSGSLEYDVHPAPGKKGRITVRVTKLPPGDSAKPEVKEFEFEVK
jgi:hypothetical protein